MEKQKYQLIEWLILFVPVFFLMMLFTPIQKSLVFEYENSGKVLAYIPVKEGDTFQLKYTHSIQHNLPITEPLEIRDTREAVRAEVFELNEFPQMLLRVGWAPVNSDPLPATPRRELAEVVARLHNSRPD